MATLSRGSCNAESTKNTAKEFAKKRHSVGDGIIGALHGRLQRVVDRASPVKSSNWKPSVGNLQANMLQQILSVVGLVISILLTPLYIVFLGLGSTPFFQRQYGITCEINLPSS